MPENDLHEDDIVELPVDGVLDLHPFRPSETIDVVEEYIRVCLEKNITPIRVIHGKGIGVQKTRVHAFLAKHPQVLSYGLDSAGPSGWGATVVNLKVGNTD